MKWYAINKENTINVKKEKKYRDVYILDEIGGYGVWAKDFIRDLMQIEADVINLHIDSAGGSITDGVAIYNALRAHSAEVHTYVDGIAASIASVIYLAGDKRYIPENAGIFTHLPMLAELDMPNRKDLQEAQDHLAKFETVLSGIYMKHTGANEEQVKTWMEKDTWFFGQEAVDAGFATDVVDKVAVAAQYDPTKYDFIKTKHPSLQAEQTEKEPTMEDVQVASEEEVAQEEVVATEEVAVEASVEVETEAQVEELVEESEVEEVEVEEAEADDVELEKTEEVAEEVYARAVQLNELAEKYDSCGDLKQAVIDAIINGTSVEDFKDEVLQVVSARASSKKMESKQKSEKSEIEELRGQLASLKDPAEKAIVARKIRALR